jgi:biopolymer transport protein ExbB
MIELLEKGGPFMWPLLICSGVLVILVFERIWTYWRIRDESEIRKILQVVKQLSGAEEGSRDVESYCERIGRLEGYVFAVSLEHHRRLTKTERSVEEIRQELRVTAREATYKYLGRYLPCIGGIAQVATLLGLLGTISGMIRSFGAMTRSGIGESIIIAGGVVEALMTTGVGFLIALPSLVVYIYFTNSAERKMFWFAPYGYAFIDTLPHQRKKAA